MDVAVLVKGGEHDHLDAVVGGKDETRRRQTVHPRHAHVHKDDIRAQGTGRTHGLFAVGGLPHHLDVAFGLEHEPQPGAHHRLVVDEQDADAHVPGFPGSAGPPDTGSVARTT